jgi:2-hydroxychromene-2-carboxylate isomerase
MSIDFYFDFASPYGFIAAMQAEKITRPVKWHPVLLGSIYKSIGMSPLDHKLKVDYVINVDAPRMARRIGLQLKTPQGFPAHALPPSRAFYWLDRQDPAKAVAFAKTAYREYWLNGRATDDPAAAADAAQAVGIERAAMLEAIGQNDIKQRLIAANDEAFRRGVFGSPFFFVDGEPYWGSDRLSLIA